ncbi:MAG: ABC transporter permease, partial [Chitinophagia bacterium]|nr:ABC transporter permease [Chitinophagia bacterium]
MNKILLIIQREYLTRVKKKSFLVLTFVVPFLFMLMMSVTVYLAINEGGMGDVKKVQVIDESGWFTGKLQETKTIKFTYATGFEQARKGFGESGFDYLLYIPASLNGVVVYGEKTPSPLVTNALETSLTDVARSRRLSDAHIDPAVLTMVQQEVKVDARNLTSSGEKDANVMARYVVGLLGAFLIYMSLFLYGAQVMRGVIEEKVSRIIEVVISSVKPFQLMMGKIIGVGMVGLTQFLLWIVLTMALSTVTGSLLASRSGPAMAQMQQAMQDQPQGATTTHAVSESKSERLLQSFQDLPMAELVCAFLFYFLFGYLLYSALFAAVGSAVDSETETQQFMLPVTLPLVFTFMLWNVILNNPDSP